MIDYYDTLGISPNATPDDIKKAWRRAAQRFHPDASHDPTTEALFLMAKKAYETLSDPIMRLLYDEKREKERRRKATGIPEADSIQDIPWIREDSLILTYVTEEGGKLVLNTNAMHAYLSTLPRPIRMSVLNRFGELIDAGYIYGVAVSEEMFLVRVARTWFDAGRVKSLRIPWNEGFWEPDYEARPRRRHVWTNKGEDPRVPFQNDVDDKPKTTAQRPFTPPPPTEPRYRTETIRTSPTMSRPTKPLDSHMKSHSPLTTFLLAAVIWVGALNYYPKFLLGHSMNLLQSKMVFVDIGLSIVSLAMASLVLTLWSLFRGAGQLGHH